MLLVSPGGLKRLPGLFYLATMNDAMTCENTERDDHRGRRDSEVLRDAEEIRADSPRLKNAMRHLEHAKRALEGSGSRGLRGKKRRGNPRG